MLVGLFLEFSLSSKSFTVLATYAVLFFQFVVHIEAKGWGWLENQSKNNAPVRWLYLSLLRSSRGLSKKGRRKCIPVAMVQTCVCLCKHACALATVAS